jgi:hypothetical protein
MKSIQKKGISILVIFVAFVVVVPWGLNYLKDQIPGFPDWDVPSLSSIFKSERLPPEAILGEVKFVEFSPTTLTPGAYIRGEVSEIESSRKTKKRFQFDATSRLKLRDGQAISMDMLIGYDATDGDSPFYTRMSGSKVTLTINTSKLVSIQPRVVPFLNTDKLRCDDDRWRRAALEEGDCDFLVQSVPDLAIVGFQSCLGTTWSGVAKTIELAEHHRLNVLYEHFKRLEPKVNWQKPTLEVVFTPTVPPKWGTLPKGWKRVIKDGRKALEYIVKDGNKTTTSTIFVDRLKCTVDEGALKADLHREAQNVSKVGI